MFLCCDDSIADDNTLYSCEHYLQEIVTDLENDLSKLLDWFNIVLTSRKIMYLQ